METQKILYVDMDNVLVDFPSAFSKIEKDVFKAYEDKDDITWQLILKQAPDQEKIYVLLSVRPNSDDDLDKVEVVYYYGLLSKDLRLVILASI